MSADVDVACLLFFVEIRFGLGVGFVIATGF
jgi:hypothetical protein